ncbi:hypothetical protein HDIA_4000 [Hartmannibacter diazotrophicus]|uniref:BD-FAE-like domain-containing protein n=1 Tax=Hartmannibacter diazotrophicus TaxID=1482074 RepID=A0A2C9DCS5_9HYPH|nr:subtype B tannase [Hartmannibacter diazotrophicus]SON57541.1 hypothetical protein HDIA_4000 [Hartmannibacter diazotrophicus]
MIGRRDILKLGLGAGTVLGAAGVLAGFREETPPDSGRKEISLIFDKDTFVERKAMVPVHNGVRNVTYRFYKAVPYVGRPVDLRHQSLNISVPVRIDGRPVDASEAPILFHTAVGGFNPASVVDRNGAGENINVLLALGAGHVVVEPGARGRTLVSADGVHYGVAPAAIVDLKAAVRYLRFNKGRVPGNTDRIVTSGTSAGGAMSSLLGATGDSPLYEPHLKTLEAAEASDAVFASGVWCPIIDLEHADMAYEWNWGDNPLQGGGRINRAVSDELRAAFAGYQASLGLRGLGGFGPLTAETMGDYLTRTYLQPAAGRFLKWLPEKDRAAYLGRNRFMSLSGDDVSFDWNGFLAHVGPRMKAAPAFDAFDLSSPENNLFGLGRTPARHFTLYGLRHGTGNPAAELDADLAETVRMMNPMPFLKEASGSHAKHWWIRVGTMDTDTSLSVSGNLAAAAENLGYDVNAAMYWDGGHAVNYDPGAFVKWIGDIAGYSL